MVNSLVFGFLAFLLASTHAVLSPNNGVAIRKFLEDNFKFDRACNRTICSAPNGTDKPILTPVCGILNYIGQNEQEILYVVFDNPCEVEYAQCFQGVDIIVVPLDECKPSDNELYETPNVKFVNDNSLREYGSWGQKAEGASRQKREAKASEKSEVLSVKGNLHEIKNEIKSAVGGSAAKNKIESNRRSIDVKEVLNVSQNGKEVKRHTKKFQSQSNITVSELKNITKKSSLKSRRFINVDTVVAVNHNEKTDNSTKIKITGTNNLDDLPIDLPGLPRKTTEAPRRRPRRTTRRPRSYSRSREHYRSRSRERRSRSREHHRSRSREHRSRSRERRSKEREERRSKEREERRSKERDERKPDQRDPGKNNSNTEDDQKHPGEGKNETNGDDQKQPKEDKNETNGGQDNWEPREDGTPPEKFEKEERKEKDRDPREKYDDRDKEKDKNRDKYDSRDRDRHRDRYDSRDRDRDRDRPRDRYDSRDRDRDKDRHRERYDSRDRDRDRHRERYDSRDRDRDRHRDRYDSRDRDRDRHRDRYDSRDRDRDRDRHRDRYDSRDRDRDRDRHRDRYDSREYDRDKYKKLHLTKKGLVKDKCPLATA